MIDPNVRATNQAVIEGLTSKDPFLQKEAQVGVNDYLRLRAREDGFARRIQPPVPVTPADLDRQVDTVKPVIVKDVEPDTPSALTVPFGAVPMNHYIDAPRYRVMFDRILSHRFIADVANLLTYDMDIRQIFNDLMLKDILAEEDRKYIATVDVGVGPLNDTDPTTNARLAEVGALGNVTVGPLNRTSLSEAMKGLPSTNRHLNPASALINNITIWDIVSLDRNEVGGDLAEEMFINGFAERQIMGLKWMITIKTDLVPTDVIYYFGAPKFLGDFYTLEDVTVSTKHENYLFEMFAYEMIGGTVKNTGAIARAQFTDSLVSWVPPVVTSSSSSST
jgi:hypothetical protein